MFNALPWQMRRERAAQLILHRRRRYRDGDGWIRFRYEGLRLIGFQIFDQEFQLHQLAGVTLRRLAELGALEAGDLQLKFLDQKRKAEAFLFLCRESVLQVFDGGITREDESF